MRAVEPNSGRRNETGGTVIAALIQQMYLDIPLQKNAGVGGARGGLTVGAAHCDPWSGDEEDSVSTRDGVSGAGWGGHRLMPSVMRGVCRWWRRFYGASTTLRLAACRARGRQPTHGSSWSGRSAWARPLADTVSATRAHGLLSRGSSSMCTRWITINQTGTHLGCRCPPLRRNQRWRLTAMCRKR